MLLHKCSAPIQLPHTDLVYDLTDQILRIDGRINSWVVLPTRRVVVVAHGRLEVDVVAAHMHDC